MHRPDRTTLGILPLENGDRLTRSAFERRYEAMPHVKKAELINGVVYLHSRVRAQSHGQPHGFIMTWLGTYVAATPYVMLCDNTTVRLDPDNEIQPDALLRIDEKSGGRSRLSEDDYVEGAPELVVEVAASSASYDLHDKKTVCRRHGVPAYVVWRVFDGELGWFVLEDDAYLRLEPDAEGLLRSRALPGLHLSARALLEGDLAGVLEAVQRGTSAEEHQAFAHRLERRRASG